MTVEKFITRRSEYKKHNYENGEANPLFFSHLASKAVSNQQQRGEGPANTLASYASQVMVVETLQNDYELVLAKTRLD